MVNIDIRRLYTNKIKRYLKILCSPVIYTQDGRIKPIDVRELAS